MKKGKGKFEMLVKKFILSFFAVIVLAISGTTAEAELASIRVGNPLLVDPPNADIFYGGLANHSTSVNLPNGKVELNELARSLRYDPALIFEYVRNKIEIEPTFGLTKGALGAHFDNYGTAFDQAHLLVELLKIADTNSSSNISAIYKYGEISLSPLQFEKWFGITDAKAACYFLARGGFPATVNSSGGQGTDCATIASVPVSSVTMSHVWVEITVDGGAPVEVDPSFKDHDFPDGLSNLATIMGYSAAGLTSEVGCPTCSQSGVSYVDDIRYEDAQGNGIKNTLDGYAVNLLNHIKNNMPDEATMEDVIGGQEIIEALLPNGLASAPLEYTVLSSSDWSNVIPDQFRTTLKIEVYEAPTDTHKIKTLFADEIYGRAVQLVPNTATALGSVTTVDANVKLQVDGKTLFTFAKPDMRIINLSRMFIELTINHPYAASSDNSLIPDGTYMDRFSLKRADTELHTTILHGWGHISQQTMSRFGVELPLDDKLPDANSGNSGSEALDLIGASMANNTNLKIGANWLAQMSLMGDLQARVGNGIFQHHHSVGLVFSEVRMERTEEAEAWFVADQVTRMDIDSGIGVTHKGGLADNENAIAQSIASAANALEGSIFEQMQDTPDTASTAERFEWGEANAPAMKYLKFTSSDVGAVDGLIIANEGDFCVGWCPIDDLGPNPTPEEIAHSYYRGMFEDQVEDEITNYLNDGYTVVAASEAFLGPGYHMGYLSAFAFDPLFPSGGGDPFGDTVCSEEHLRKIKCNLAGSAFSRDGTMQRGGAFIAYKTDANGFFTEIAHIVADSGGLYKGGGASLDPQHEEQFNPSEAADILKDRFEDRSAALGVDLGSGIPGYSSGTLISVGGGGFPYELSAEVSYNRGDRYLDSGAGHMFGMSHNWDIEVSTSGSGMEAMGESSVQNAVASIVNFFVAQDVVKQDPTDFKNITLVPFINHWWLGHMTNNVASVSGGGSGFQFFRQVDGTFSGPPGSAAKLEQFGTREAKRKNEGGAGGVLDPAGINRYWDYTNVKDASEIAFILTLPDGSKQYFRNFTVIPAPAQTWFLLDRWEMPSGFTINLTYQNFTGPVGENLGSITAKKKIVHEVTNTFGRKLTFDQEVSGGQSNLTAFMSIADDHGRIVNINLVNNGGAASTSAFLINHVDGTQTKVSPGCIAIQVLDVCTPGGSNNRPLYGAQPVTEVFSPNDLNNALLRYTFDGLQRVKLAEDAQSVLDVATSAPNPRPGHQFFIVEGHRGERMDPLGGEFTVYYDQDGNAAEFIDELGRVVTAKFDGIGRVVERTFPEFDKSCFKYDQNSNITEFKQVAKGGQCTDTTNVRTVFATWDLNWNKLTSVTDFNGNQTTFLFEDSLGGSGQVTKAILPKPDALPSPPEWIFVYNSDGQILSTTDPKGVQILNGYDLSPGFQKGNLISLSVDASTLNYTSHFEYDDIGNRTAMIDARDPNGTGTDFRIEAEFDSMRQIVRTVGAEGQEIRLFYDPEGQQIILEQVLANTFLRTETVYSPTGNVVSTKSPDGAITTNFYDHLDRIWEVHDLEGRITRYAYDSVGQLLKEIRAYGTPLQQDYATYSYSDNGQQVSLADAKGNTSEFFFDGFDRVVEFRYPDPLTSGQSNLDDNEIYTYDSNDNLLSKITRADDLITNIYNKRNQIISKRADKNNGSGNFVEQYTIQYAYDARGRQTEIKFADDSQHVKNIYDGLGKITETRTLLPGLSGEKVLTFSYDQVGNRTSIVHPDSKQFSYIFDKASQITSIRSGTPASNDILAAFTLDEIGRRTKMVLDTAGSINNRTVNYFYEPDSALDTLEQMMSGSTNDVTYAFDYNLANQVLIRTVDNDIYLFTPVPKDEDYTSNGLNQYTDINVGGTPVTLTYDANGNLTNDGTWAYTYDVENRLLSATDGTTAATYVYDPLGRRVKKSGTGVTTTYYLNDDINEILELNSTGGITRRYVFGPGVDEPIVMYAGTSTNDGAKTYYRADHQGSIIAITDDRGREDQTYTYDAYGAPSISSPMQPIMYTGRRWDAETSLYYYRARYYNPSLGRFLQTDPVGYEAGLNIYGYVGNDPMSNTDPLGLDNCEVVPAGTIECVGDADADPDSQEGNASKEETDSVAVQIKDKDSRTNENKRTASRLRDGLSVSGERGFGIRGQILSFEKFLRSENVLVNGQLAGVKNFFDKKHIGSFNAAGHVHGKGFNDGIGPEDQKLAKFLVGGTAYIVFKSGIAAVELIGGSFRARLIEGNWGTGGREATEELVNKFNQSGNSTTAGKKN